MSSLLRKLSNRATRRERNRARFDRGTHMSEQTQQQGEPGIGLANQYSYSALIGSLMDIQHVLRSVPNIVAGGEAARTRVAELEAKVAELEARLAALAPKAVEGTDTVQ